MMPSVTMLATCWFAEPVTDRLATEQPDSNGSGTAPPRRGVIGFFVHHRLAANLVMLVMLLGGTLALTRMNVQFFPTFALDVVSVRVVWSGASAEDIEQGITNPPGAALAQRSGAEKDDVYVGPECVVHHPRIACGGTGAQPGTVWPDSAAQR